ncbi:RtcB family protein [Candidatus Peregrinibacteria bacterium]|nr:RtcB family protein [Candidatus Peregrinibacteria bacterium]
MPPINKLSDCIYCLAQEGRMRVPLHIIADEKTLERMQSDKCLEQGINMATLPGILEHAVLMPDAHQGYGFPIGGVAAFDAKHGVISPGGIGYDINCSVSLLSTNLDKADVEPKIHEILEQIFARVPCGVGEGGAVKLSFEELDEVLNTGIEWAIKKGYADENDRQCTEEYGVMRHADSDKISKKAKERGKGQLGTLGAGNHFLEIQIVDKIFDAEIAEIFGLYHEGQICVMVHCGSRGLGHQNCTDYLRIAETHFPDITRGLADRELAYFPAESPEAKDYFAAMCAAANFAFANHRVICWNIRRAFREVFKVAPLRRGINCLASSRLAGLGLNDKIQLPLVYHIAHNMVKLEEFEINGVKKQVFLHRKGATRALPPDHKNNPARYMKTGHPILLPGSMGTASYVLAGTEKAAKETFCSTPHGSGRLMSRHEANRKFRGEKLKSELEHQKIYIRSASWRGISEEAPLAYKNVDEIAQIAHSAGIGKIVARLKPFGVIKG